MSDHVRNRNVGFLMTWLMCIICGFFKCITVSSNASRYMSHVTRKPVRFLSRSDTNLATYTTTEDDLRLEISDIGSREIALCMY